MRRKTRGSAGKWKMDGGGAWRRSAARAWAECIWAWRKRSRDRRRWQERRGRWSEEIWTGSLRGKEIAKGIEDDKSRGGEMDFEGCGEKDWRALIGEMKCGVCHHLFLCFVVKRKKGLSYWKEWTHQCSHQSIYFCLQLEHISTLPADPLRMSPPVPEEAE